MFGRRPGAPCSDTANTSVPWKESVQDTTTLGFNLGILMRQVFGWGTPRGLQGDPFDAGSLEIALAILTERLWATTSALLAHVHLRQRVLCGHSGWAIA